VIGKPGKPPEIRKTPGGWRPISLLSTVGKILEAAIGERMAAAAEAANILLEGQIGNRKGRSTDLVVRVLTKAVRAAWSQKAVASLL